jgi:hypothetical protein
MSEFEFLIVFISVVIGLGVTHILHGVGRIIHNRGRIEVDTLHAVWTANVLLILVLNWWVSFSWRDFTEWSFDIYLILIAWSISLYMLAVVLYPPDIRGDESYAELFQRNRQWLFVMFILMIGLDIAQTALRDDLLNPPIYLPFVLQYALLSAIGMRVDGRRYQSIFAWWVLISLVVWSLLVRRLLEA